VATLPALLRRAPTEDLWALRDVSFELGAGEAVGVIGRNGAGKSTLFKLLARITHPSTGTIRLRGRLGSLLEVGTGFHPDLSGRENVFLNGAILGMRREEVRRRFDEIVAFAELDRFIDEPVKHYSSGMFMRLGFAVAAHLDTEILLVDEVLAVGDLGFQERCLGAMRTAADGGRTVLFVSHNLGAVRALTRRCLYLADGRLAADGPSNEVVARYYDDVRAARSASATGGLDWFRRPGPADPPVRVVAIDVNGKDDVPTLSMGQDVTITLTLEVRRAVKDVGLSVTLKDAAGARIAVVYSPDAGFGFSGAPGTHQVTLRLANAPLAPGRHHADIGANQSARSAAYDVLLDVPLFEVACDGVTAWSDRPWGAVHLSGAWEARA
jgi:lipopolysaccharide transport system ATP-binding protein